MARKLVAVLSMLGIAAAAMAITSCNTVEGTGKDLKAGGQAIEKAAERNKSY
jgi:predicted small secreted protein